MIPADATPSTASGHRLFASAGDAVEAILSETRPRVVGFGEYHELTGATMRSAMSRFHAGVVPALASRTSDLVLEFWARDACGEKSAAVNRNVARMTERPASTGNEVIDLLTESKKRGVTNHVLRLGCADYDSILDPAGEVDYEKLLVLVTRKLYEQTDVVLTARAGPRRPPPGRDLVLVYGGALHNNLRPPDGTADLSYAPDLAARTGGAFVEVDLVVPEYVADNQLARAEAWYPMIAAHASPDRVVLVPRGPRSYVLILRKGLVKKP